MPRNYISLSIGNKSLRGQNMNADLPNVDLEIKYLKVFLLNSAVSTCLNRSRIGIYRRFAFEPKLLTSVVDFGRLWKDCHVKSYVMNINFVQLTSDNPKA